MTHGDFVRFCNAITCCPSCRAFDPLRYWVVERSEYQAEFDRQLFAISGNDLEGEENSHSVEVDAYGRQRFFCRTCNWNGSKPQLAAWLGGYGLINRAHVVPLAELTERPLPLGTIVETLQGEVGLATASGDFVNQVPEHTFGFIAKSEETVDIDGGRIRRYLVLFPRGRGMLNAQPIAPVTWGDMENRDLYQVYESGIAEGRLADPPVPQRRPGMEQGRVVIIEASNPVSTEPP